MSSIQDIHVLEQRISDIVEDYIKKFYNDDDVLAIGLCCGNFSFKADKQEKIKVGKTTEIYPLKHLIRTDDNGNPELDCDKISDIANSWLFIE